jgi:hypothetical protein
MIAAKIAALAVGAVLAAPASGAHSPFSETVSPAAFHVAPGHTAVVRVTDTGKSPLHLVTSVTQVSTRCHISQAPVAWARVTPSVLNLQPGQTATVRVHIARAVPADGHDLAVNAESVAPGNARVAIVADVASQVLVSGKAGPQAGCQGHTTHRLPVAAAGLGLPSWPLVGGFIGIVFPLMITIAWRRTRHHRGSRARVRAEGRHA